MKPIRNEYLNVNLDVFCEGPFEERNSRKKSSSFLDAIQAINYQAARKRISKKQVEDWLYPPDEEEKIGDFEFIKYSWESGGFLNAVTGTTIFVVYGDRIIPYSN